MRIASLVSRIIKQIIGDKRTLMLMLVAPLLILSLMNLVFAKNDNSNIKVGYYNMNSSIVATLSDNNLNMQSFDNDTNIKNQIENNNLTAFMYMDGSKLDVVYDNSNMSNKIEVESKLGMAVSKYTIEDLAGVIGKQGEVIKKQSEMLKQKPEIQQSMLKPDKLTINSSYVYGNSNTSLFDGMVPVLIGFFVFFFVFLISGMSLLKERTSGTLDKLLATPIRRFEIVFGYLIGYGLFAIVQTIIIVGFAVYILNINIVGSIGLVILINIVVAFSALALGLLISTFANSEFQMMQFIPIIILPQIFLSGLIPISSMNVGIQHVAKVMPMYYAGNALTDVIIKGYSFDKIVFDILIVLLFAIIFTVINIIGLRRYRKV